MNAMLEPRMVAAKIHGPFTAAGWEHRLLRITASSQGGLAIVAIRPFSAESLSVGSRRGRDPEALANVGFSSSAVVLRVDGDVIYYGTFSRLVKGGTLGFHPRTASSCLAISSFESLPAIRARDLSASLSPCLRATLSQNHAFELSWLTWPTSSPRRRWMTPRT